MSATYGALASGALQCSQSLPVGVESGALASGALQGSQSMSENVLPRASQVAQSVQRMGLRPRGQASDASESAALGPEGGSDESFIFVSGDEF